MLFLYCARLNAPLLHYIATYVTAFLACIQFASSFFLSRFPSSVFAILVISLEFTNYMLPLIGAVLLLSFRELFQSLAASSLETALLETARLFGTSDVLCSTTRFLQSCSYSTHFSSDVIRQIFGQLSWYFQRQFALGNMIVMIDICKRCS